MEHRLRGSVVPDREGCFFESRWDDTRPGEVRMYIVHEATQMASHICTVTDQSSSGMKTGLRQDRLERL